MKKAIALIAASLTGALAPLLAAEAIIVEAESGTFSGWVDRHSCWHNVMLTDESHSTHSGKGVVDTPNKVGAFIEVAYDALWTGSHRITVRYTHIKPDPRPGELWINGKKGPVLQMPQNKALPALNTDSAAVDLPQGRNLIRIVALNEGGLGNVDYIKVAELREIPSGALPRIQVLEAEDGLHQGKIDHHSCWNFIAQHKGGHTGFTGEGYVDTDNKLDSYVELTFDTPAAGSYLISARYVHGKEDTRRAEVKVNGEVVDPSLPFRPTGFWTNWTYLPLSRSVELKKGRNVVRFTAKDAEGLANLDHIKLVPAPASAAPVRLSQVQWAGVGCYKVEMPMGTVYFEKDNGVSGFKSFIDNEGNDWIASYMPPGPNGDFRGFPNSIGNFGHAGRDSGSTTTIVDGKTEGDVVILESTNGTFTFQYWFFADRVAIKVLKSGGDYHFLLETVAGGTADAEDYFVTADGKKRIPRGEFADITPEWFYIGDPRAKNVLFFAKTPEDDAPNENHRQIRPNGMHNMDLYSFGRTGADRKYQTFGMSGNEHVCVIGFAPASRTHSEMTALIEAFLEQPFKTGVRARQTSGGWPQFWPLRGDEYYSRITYNDGAMIRVMDYHGTRAASLLERDYPAWRARLGKKS